MSNDTDLDPEIEEIVNEAREGFSVRDALKQQVKRREATITIYTDERTAELLGDARDEVNTFGLPGRRIREGVLGELDKALADLEELVEKGEKAEADDDTLADQIAEATANVGRLRERAQELKTKLDETAIDFTLAGVPSLLTEACERQARSILKIKGKIPEERLKEYNRVFTALIHAKIITSVTFRALGKTLDKITYQEALDLRDELPQSEWARLDQKIADVQYKQSVGEQAVQEATFSQAG